MTNKINVLVIGYRKMLNQALKKMNIPFSVLKDPSDLNEKPLTKFTHVIPAGEGSVVLANQIRKKMGLNIIPEKTISLCSDKLLMKQQVVQSKIPVTSFLSGGTKLSSKQIYQKLGNKVIVKDRNNSGGKGQKFFTHPETISSNKSQLIETFIIGKEMSIESFIQNGEIKFVSTTWYQENGVINIVPTLIDSEIESEVLELNKKVINSFNINSGLTHLEVYITSKGVIFGEIALRPPGGHIMTLMNLAWGIDPWESYIKVNIGIPLDCKKILSSHAGVIVYHPGEGVIKQIKGEDEIKRLKSLIKYRIKDKIGDLVTKRNGVGQERAHFIFCSHDRDILMSDVKFARQNFSFEFIGPRGAKVQSSK